MAATTNGIMSCGASRIRHGWAFRVANKKNVKLFNLKEIYISDDSLAVRNNEISSTTMKAEAQTTQRNVLNRGLKMKYPQAELSSLRRSRAEIIKHDINCIGNKNH